MSGWSARRRGPADESTTSSFRACSLWASGVRDRHGLRELVDRRGSGDRYGHGDCRGSRTRVARSDERQAERHIRTSRLAEVQNRSLWRLAALGDLGDARIHRHLEGIR